MSLNPKTKNIVKRLKHIYKLAYCPTNPHADRSRWSHALYKVLSTNNSKYLQYSKGKPKEFRYDYFRVRIDKRVNWLYVDMVAEIEMGDNDQDYVWDFMKIVQCDCNYKVFMGKLHESVAVDTYNLDKRYKLVIDALSNYKRLRSGDTFLLLFLIDIKNAPPNRELIVEEYVIFGHKPTLTYKSLIKLNKV